MSQFESRCLTDPQGVIKDLIGQITRQSRAIYELNLLNDKLKILLDNAGIEIPVTPVEKKKRGRTKKVEKEIIEELNKLEEIKTIEEE